MKKLDIMPKDPAGNYQRYFSQVHGMRLGNPTRTLYEKGGEDLLDWLAENTPEGMSIMDMVAAICVDAMNEDKID